MIAGRRTVLAAITALVVAILFAASGVWPSYRTKSNGPEISIGKSGEMKSPGGTIAEPDGVYAKGWSGHAATGTPSYFNFPPIKRTGGRC